MAQINLREMYDALTDAEKSRFWQMNQEFLRATIAKQRQACKTIIEARGKIEQEQSNEYRTDTNSR